MPNTPQTWLNRFNPATQTNGIQKQPDIIQLTNGNMLVSWNSNEDIGAGSPASYDIIGQLLDPLGNKIGGEFLVNISHSANIESDAHIAALPGGGFIATYRELNSATNSISIRLNEFDANGTHVVDSTTVLNDASSGYPIFKNPDIAVSSATSVLIVYEHEPNAVDPTDVVGKLYNPVTDSYSAQFDIVAGTVSPEIIVLANGNYVIVSSTLVAGSGMKYSIFNSTGAEVASPNNVSNTNANGESDHSPSLTALTGGGFVIAWQNTDANDTDIKFQIYNSGGTPVGATQLVDDAGVNDSHHNPLVISLNDGGFAVVYRDSGNLEVARYDAAGTKVGSTYTVATIDPALDIRPISGVLLEDGRFALTWEEEVDDDAANIQVEILDIRDGANFPPVYTPDDWQVGTIGDDLFLASGAIVHGWAGNDIIVDDEPNANAVYAGDGDDSFFINGIDSSEYADGGDGVDTLNISGVDDDTLIVLSIGYMRNGDTIQAVENFENVVGSAVDERIFGSAADNDLKGGAGQDQLFGEAGNDRITYDAADDLANVLGGADTDTLVINGGAAPVGFDLGAHEFEIAEHSFGIVGGAQRDTYNADWQRTDRTIYQDDGSRSETIFDPANATDTVQIDNNFDTTGAYVSQTGFYDNGGRWAAQFNLDGPNDYIYNYFDDQNRLDTTVGAFDDGRTFLEDADQGNLNDWTSKYAVNTAANQADYQYDYYDNGTRSYLEHDQNGVEIYLYQYTFYDVNDDPDYYYGKYNDGTDYYFDL